MPTTPKTATTGLLTDRYELTMLASFLAGGVPDRRAVFETFARRLPSGRRFGLYAGLGRLLPLIERFRFAPDDIDWLLEGGVIDDETARYLGEFRFTGDIVGLREGDVYFPGTPVLTVSGTLGECVLLETLVLSVLNHDTAIASAAARMVTAAGDRPVIEMGSRRTHEEAAIATARAAYLAGFAATSNLAAGRRYGVPTTGTAAHAFVLAHPTELDAFRSQLRSQGPDTTLLVDTYDVAEGIRNAVTAARLAGLAAPAAVRIDSGDLAAEAWRARALLDGLGASETRIIVTSDLDEHVMAALSRAPIDGYGVGTRVATGSGHPTAGMVYKLVAIADEDGPTAPLRPVAKTAPGKTSAGGRKTVWRASGPDGVLRSETHTVGEPTLDMPPEGRSQLAQVTLVESGRVVHDVPLDRVRAHAARCLASLPAGALDLDDGDPAIVPTLATPTRQEVCA